jgi:uncharacterized protein (UPF0335 family)
MPGIGDNANQETRVTERLIRLEKEAKDIAEAKKDVLKELTTKEAKAAVRLAVKRHFEAEDKKAAREAAEESAEQILAAIGPLAGTGLGSFAMGQAAE